MLRRWAWCLVLFTAVASAKDNELTPQEVADGWKLIFNGVDFSGWKCNNGKPIGSKIEDGAIVPFKSGGYLIVYDKPLENYILKCDVKMSPMCNSGIFFRVSDLSNPVHRGFELQVMAGDGTGFHDFGAIYELAKPTKNVTSDLNVWHAVELRCVGPKLTVIANGQQITQMNCDDFTQLGVRPDGAAYKFKFPTPIKEVPRVGYVGFQDHGHPVWYKNIKLKELP